MCRTFYALLSACCGCLLSTTALSYAPKTPAIVDVVLILERPLGHHPMASIDSLMCCVCFCRRSSLSSLQARHARNCLLTWTMLPSPPFPWRPVRSCQSSGPLTLARPGASAVSTLQIFQRCCCTWRFRSGARRQLSAQRLCRVTMKHSRLQNLLLLRLAGEAPVCITWPAVSLFIQRVLCLLLPHKWWLLVVSWLCGGCWL